MEDQVVALVDHTEMMHKDISVEEPEVHGTHVVLTDAAQVPTEILAEPVPLALMELLK
jgi:hypothetical protein